MRNRTLLAILVLTLPLGGASLPAQETPRPQIATWPAPAFWQPPPVSENRIHIATKTAVNSPLPFIPVTPCRMLDTRITGGAIVSGSTRDVALTGAPCGIPSNAAAVSANFAVFNITGTSASGVLLVYPTDSPSSAQAIVNWSPTSGQIDNASVVPLGTGGSITVQPNQGAGTIDLVIDVNGYYGGSVVTTLNDLFGDVTLAPGSNVTITPAGQTLTIASTGGPGGVLPTGASGQTLRHDGMTWVANSALTSDGTDVTVTRILNFGGRVRVFAFGGSDPYLHDGGSDSTFLGLDAGKSSTTGVSNTGIGHDVLRNNSSGSVNTAVGNFALSSNTVANGNTAVGSQALFDNTTGAYNTANGLYALLLNTTGVSNTAIGASALFHNTTGFFNTAIGFNALFSNASSGNNIAVGAEALLNAMGGGNIGIGRAAGRALTTGDGNIYIGSFGGAADESHTIRIGTPGSSNPRAFIVGINESSVAGVPVFVDSSGQLGTQPSSRRAKQAIREIAEASEGLMKLHPVAFQYKPEIDPTGLTQYGLIAEEVAEIYPELVVFDREGRPETVRYHLINALLLDEVQKQRRSIVSQEAEIERLKVDLSALRALVGQH